MDSKQIRTKFKDFFCKNGHTIVASDSMVIKDDPTLMFTNAGMNQFKDIFLGIRKPENLCVANSQKCLRVSGKHNDIEDVGHDTYHHTMFEMLGNWSFGDYFKNDAIRLAWELLTKEFQIPEDRLFVTVFGGDKNENLDVDSEAEEIWKHYIDSDRILYGSKKDNFWEMGDMGPCGPCSEIHVDIREENERKTINGKNLVNKDHPQVIEIWNLVFIQFNRKADGKLESLPQKHVDTGMGFERLCAVLQGKKSNYDTDIFQTIITEISKITKINYNENSKSDIALRVVADHLRAISFAIADGRLPSNVKAGYVIRRILRRAVRYYYSFLNTKEPILYKLVDVLVKQMGDDYPELKLQQKIIENVIFEEENTFLKTLDKGIKLLDTVIAKANTSKISGKDTFILYDTYGFPLDLTELIAKENGFSVDIDEFNKEMQKQKERARNAAAVETDDWTVVNNCESTIFVGYDYTTTDIKITKYRKVKHQNTSFFQLVFSKTPFFAESGGQVGDTGIIKNVNEKIFIENTIKENNQIIHISKTLPDNVYADFEAIVDVEKQKATARNHSATHLLHFALRKILGNHVEQKGSLVDSNKLRFDFSHFNKVSDEEIKKIENFINILILKAIQREEKRNCNIEEAKKSGAMMLFGEKYGEKVRVIRFGDSIELCGGIHVENIGEIGYFKIISENAVAAGIRRIEALTGCNSIDYIQCQLDIADKLKQKLNNPKDINAVLDNLLLENLSLKKQIESYHIENLKIIKQNLLAKSEIKQFDSTDIIFIYNILNDLDINDLKEICSQIRGEINNFVCILGSISNEKPYISIALSENLTKEKNLNAGLVIREIAKHIDGNGGGQAFIATAGGKNTKGLANAIEFGKKIIEEKIFNTLNK